MSAPFSLPVMETNASNSSFLLMRSLSKETTILLFSSISALTASALFLVGALSNNKRVFPLLSTSRRDTNAFGFSLSESCRMTITSSFGTSLPACCAAASTLPSGCRFGSAHALGLTSPPASTISNTMTTRRMLRSFPAERAAHGPCRSGAACDLFWLSLYEPVCVPGGRRKAIWVEIGTISTPPQERRPRSKDRGLASAAGSQETDGLQSRLARLWATSTSRTNSAR